jgi:hypothetical protein
VRTVPLLFLAGSLVPAVVGAAPDAAISIDPASLQGFLISTAIANLTIAFTVVLLCVFGLYAYASLARLAPYHTWIYLYLLSFCGIVWAVFLVSIGGPFQESIFILTTIVGINLIVYLFRFDHVVIPFTARERYGVSDVDKESLLFPAKLFTK